MKIIPHFILLLSVFTLGSCQKEEVVPDILDNEEIPRSFVPAYSFKANDATAVLHALNTVSYKDVAIIGPQKIDLNTAVAYFFSSPGSKPFVDAGSVNCEGRSLSKDTASLYFYNPSGTDVITFNGTTDWSISGNVSSGIPLLNFSSSSTIPTYNGVYNGTLTANINRANDLTINLIGAVFNADSVFVTVSSGNNFVQKVVASSSNCTFLSAELLGLGSSNGSDSGVIQVAPFKVDTQINAGKKFYFINQAAYTKSVTIN